MPDLVSHVLIALIICELFSIKPKSLVILGAILPDITQKFYLVHLFIPTSDSPYWLLLPFHTPIGQILLSFIIIQLFRFDRKKAFIYLTIGWSSHIFADMFSRHFLLGQLLLFPLSWKSFEFGLMWFEQYYIILAVLIVIYLSTKMLKSHFPPVYFTGGLCKNKQQVENENKKSD